MADTVVIVVQEALIPGDFSQTVEDIDAAADSVTARSASFADTSVAPSASNTTLSESRTLTAGESDLWFVRALNASGVLVWWAQAMVSRGGSPAVVRMQASEVGDAAAQTDLTLVCTDAGSGAYTLEIQNKTVGAGGSGATYSVAGNCIHLETA